MWRFQIRAHNIHAPAKFSLFAMQPSQRNTGLKDSHIFGKNLRIKKCMRSGDVHIR
jgi:hypothetical protein